MSGDAVVQPFSALFREELRQSDPQTLVNKYVISGECQKLAREQYYNLRAEIADWAGVHVNDVVMVGSGKLGFSISPEQPFKEFDAGERSDFDMAIISSSLFDYYWRNVFAYSRYSPYWKERGKFESYIIQGWMRPDHLPNQDFELKQEWWRFFNSLANLQRYDRRKISAGIYKNWDFLEAYQTDGLAKCKLKVGKR
jgi:hypothetical protein